MLNLSSILINSKDPKVLIKFYEEVFGKKVDEMSGWLLGEMYLVILEHSEVDDKNEGVSRLMFNLETQDVKAEFDRISKIEGASVIKEPYQMKEWDGWISTLADPDGNYFQLMSPWEETK